MNQVEFTRLGCCIKDYADYFRACDRMSGGKKKRHRSEPEPYERPTIHEGHRLTHVSVPDDPPVPVRMIRGTRKTLSWISSELQANKDYHPNPPGKHPLLYPEWISPEYLNSILGNDPRVLGCSVHCPVPDSGQSGSASGIPLESLTHVNTPIDLRFGFHLIDGPGFGEPHEEVCGDRPLLLTGERETDRPFTAAHLGHHFEGMTGTQRWYQSVRSQRLLAGRSRMVSQNLSLTYKCKKTNQNAAAFQKFPSIPDGVEWLQRWDEVRGSSKFGVNSASALFLPLAMKGAHRPGPLGVRAVLTVEGGKFATDQKAYELTKLGAFYVSI